MPLQHDVTNRLTYLITFPDNFVQI